MNDSKRTKKEAINDGWQALRRGGGSPKALLILAKELMKHGRIGLARRILALAREDKKGLIDSHALSVTLRQQHALATYKDPDQPRHIALAQALRILDHQGDLKTTENQETLGLAGAIFKRRFEVDAHKANLERSLAYYYERGHKPASRMRRDLLAGQELPPTEDVNHSRTLEGYTSINAAFVLDRLASLEEEEARETSSVSPIADMRRKQAQEVREELVEVLPQLMDAKHIDKNWWSLVTLAEAQFGLGHYEQASETLSEAKSLDPKPEPWMFESTATQLVALARMRRRSESDEGALQDSPAWRTVETLLDGEGDAPAVQSLFAGKLGLALSGGGFRAAFFHIGVMARLAEHDLLRHVHVLSCVSGGSVLGAQYYLELKQLLENKRDAVVNTESEDSGDDEPTIERGDYIDIVGRLATQFLAGVQKNLRMRVVGSFIGNLKMAFLPSYSRTNRLGELFESQLYAKVEDGVSGERYMDQLKIEPKGSPGFRPKSHNWRRRNKVPMLVLNATSLNTGHNWQFTSTWMGESPFSIDPEIDGNWRLRRMWYSEAPDEYRSGRRRIRLGTAVGASACVPGLFEPVALPELYSKVGKEGEPEINVRLIDGGAHDNQGVASLLEQDCTVLIVSDASGQMTSLPDPGGGVVGPLLRTNKVLMERVRQSQFQDLKARLRAGLLKGLMVLHLKKALEVDPIDWKECEEPPDIPLRRRSQLLDYNVLRGMQELLAGVRTDLDSFTEVEAHALMTSGYLMATEYVSALGDFPCEAVSREDRHPWAFLEMEGPLRTRGESRKAQDRVRKQLAVAGQGAFKAWRLSLTLKVVARLLAAAALVEFVLLWWNHSDFALVHLLLANERFELEITIGVVFWTAVTMVAGIVATRILGAKLTKIATAAFQWRETLRDIVLGVVMATVGFVAATLHLLSTDRLFLRLGRVARVLRGYSPAEEDGVEDP